MKKAVAKKVNSFFQKYERLKLKKKETLLRNTDKKIEFIYFLKKGFVRQCLIVGEEEVILNIFKPYSFFPIIFILNDISNSFNYRAMTEVEFYRAPKADVVKFIKNNPDVLLDLTARLGRGLMRLQSSLTYLFVDEARSRVHGLLWLLGKHFGIKKGKYFVLDFPLTHRDIASFTGLRRETVSREITALEKSRTLKIVKRRIWIRSKELPAKLAKKR